MYFVDGTEEYEMSFAKVYARAQLFLNDREAASAIEYAIVAAMVAVVVIAFISPIGTQIKSIFTTIQTLLVSP